MANEIKYDGLLAETGLTLYAVVVNGADGTIWNTATAAWDPVEHIVSEITDHDIPLVETVAESRRYDGDFPAGIAVALDVTVLVYIRAGAVPDLAADELLASQEFLWTGAGGKLLSAAKAMELLLAVIAGVASYDAATGVATYKRADGTTTSVVITYTGSGNRTAAVIS